MGLNYIVNNGRKIEKLKLLFGSTRGTSTQL